MTESHSMSGATEPGSINRNITVSESQANAPGWTNRHDCVGRSNSVGGSMADDTKGHPKMLRRLQSMFVWNAHHRVHHDQIRHYYGAGRIQHELTPDDRRQFDTNEGAVSHPSMGIHKLTQ
jgi:hypothetical protein